MILSRCNVFRLFATRLRILPIIFLLSNDKISQPISVLKILTNKCLQISWLLLISRTIFRLCPISLQSSPAWHLRHIRDWSFGHYRPLDALPLIALLSLLRWCHVGFLIPPLHFSHRLVAAVPHFECSGNGCMGVPGLVHSSFSTSLQRLYLVVTCSAC